MVRIPDESHCWRRAGNLNYAVGHVSSDIFRAGCIVSSPLDTRDGEHAANLNLTQGLGALAPSRAEPEVRVTSEARPAAGGSSESG